MEYDKFWDSMLSYGTRKSFHVAFAGKGWNDYTFRPPYDLKPTGTSASASMFNACSITNLVGILSSLGREIDFSKSESLRYCFSNSTITHLPLLDISSAENIDDLCGGCTKLVSIEGIVLSETIVHKFSTAFRNCRSLESIRWSGGPIRADVDLSESTKLDRASIANTIKALNCFDKNPVSNSTTWFPEGGNYVLIRLTDVPQNIEGYKALICVTEIRYEWDDELETDVEIYDEYTYELDFNENGEAVFLPESYEGTSVSEVMNPQGENVDFTCHNPSPYEETPTVTFSKTAVDKAFETSSGANNGSKSPAWYSLLDSRPYATISLI
jgi:hypothetical protein